jgi:hypothetical protein
MTPAMALGVADHLWSNAEPIDAAAAAHDEARAFTPLPPTPPAAPLAAAAPDLARVRPRLTAIQRERLDQAD